MPPRLAQKLMAGRFTAKHEHSNDKRLWAWGTPEFVADRLRQSVLITADEVLASYVARRGDAFDIHHDIPCLSPPFGNFWIEARHPDDGSENAGVRIGALFFSQDDDGRALRGPDGLISGARWILTGTLFVDLKGQASGPWRMVSIAVAPDGSPLGYWGGPGDDGLFRNLIPLLLAISFMHCKNVRAVEHPLVDSVTPKDRRGSQLQPGELKYLTLEIDPMRETLRTEGRSDEVGLKQALHLCRGHFKDYRQSGLFGKIKGIFWWDRHARGSSDAGVIVKDYDVKAGQMP